MPRAKLRIPADRLNFAHDPLFSRSLFTGAALAREMDVKDVTLWSWFSRRGLTPEDARRVAEVVDGWTDTLKDIAECLHLLADEADEASAANAEASGGGETEAIQNFQGAGSS